MYKHNQVGDSIVIVYSDGGTSTLNSSHPNYKRVKNALDWDEFPDDIYADLDVDPFDEPATVAEYNEVEEAWLREQSGNALVATANKMQRLSERVTFDGEDIYFDADKLNNTLSRHLVQVIKAGDDPTSLVNFMEKLADNPSMLSRIHVYKWLDAYDFTLTNDGDIIGYKSVHGPENRSINGNNENTVYVDGVPHTGHIPSTLR